MIKIIKAKDADEKNFAYALCYCTRTDEAIEIPRPDHNSAISFICPRCGERLGLWVRGRE